MVFGKRTGNRNIKSNMDPIVIPIIFSVFNRGLLNCVFIRIVADRKMEDEYENVSAGYF
jgi:hypothetical protein